MNPERKKLVHETTETDLVFRRMNTTWARIKRRTYYITRIFEVSTIFVESSYSDLPSCDRSPSVFSPRRRQSPPRLLRLLLRLLRRRRLLLPHAPQCREPGSRVPDVAGFLSPVTPAPPVPRMAVRWELIRIEVPSTGLKLTSSFP